MLAMWTKGPWERNEEEIRSKGPGGRLCGIPCTNIYCSRPVLYAGNTRSFIPERKEGDTPHFIISETSKVQEEIEGGQGDRDKQMRWDQGCLEKVLRDGHQ